MKTVDKGIPVFKNLKDEETRWITKGGGYVDEWEKVVFRNVEPIFFIMF